MSIHYYVDLDCTPRNEIGGEDIMEMLRNLQMADEVETEYKNRFGDDFPPEKMKFRQRVVREDGSEQAFELSVADIAKLCAPLHEHAEHCDGCPASITQTPYGCVQYLSLPISAASEQWLLARIPEAETPSGILFRQAVANFNYGRNAAIADWRNRRFLEAPAPATREIPGEDLVLTSDMILEEILLVGDIQPAHALSILVHLHAIRLSDGGDTDAAVEFIGDYLQGEAPPEGGTIEFALTPDPGDDPSVVEWKFFLLALYRAFALECPLAVRM